MGNFLIIHGSYGNQYENWFPWLHGQLEKGGKECIVPWFPTPRGQDYAVWERLLKFYIEQGIVDEGTTIITHSMSCIFVVKFCVENDFRIAKFISVAGFNNIPFSDNERLVDIVGSFYGEPERFARFKDLCPERISFYSDNDPFVPFDKGREFADMIGAEHRFMPGAGHFNWRTGQYEFEEILEYLE